MTTSIDILQIARDKLLEEGRQNEATKILEIINTITLKPFDSQMMALFKETWEYILAAIQVRKCIDLSAFIRDGKPDVANNVYKGNRLISRREDSTGSWHENRIVSKLQLNHAEASEYAWRAGYHLSLDFVTMETAASDGSPIVEYHVNGATWRCMTKWNKMFNKYIRSLDPPDLPEGIDIEIMHMSSSIGALRMSRKHGSDIVKVY